MASTGGTVLHNCYMSHIQMTGEGPRTIPTFHTIGGIRHEEDCILLLRGILLDSGASSNFISIHVVRKLGLEIRHTTPTTFTGIGGHQVVHDQYVSLSLCMGGVKARIRAFVDYSVNQRPMLLGTPGLEAFRVEARFARGTGRRTRARMTVARNVTGHRRKRYVLGRLASGTRTGTDWLLDGCLEVEDLRAGFTATEVTFIQRMMRMQALGYGVTGMGESWLTQDLDRFANIRW